MFLINIFKKKKKVETEKEKKLLEHAYINLIEYEKKYKNK